MTTPHKAMLQQALESLQTVMADVNTTPNAYEAQRQAIAALQAAIDTPEPEPLSDADIDRLTTRFHDSDCAIHCAPAYPASEVWCDCRLAELDKWESSYNSICEERDAIAKDNDKAHALLRQSLDALEAALSDDQPYIQQSKDAVTAIKEFL